MTESKHQLRTLSRALDILELVESSSRPMSLTEMARELDETAPVVFRVLQTLEARGYVRRRAEDKRYAHTGRTTGSGAIRRAVMLLRSISAFSLQGGNTTELAAHAGLDPMEVTDLLQPLADAGVVEPSHTGERWALSFGLMEIVQPLLAGDDLTHFVRPLMERLQMETEETVSLFQLARDRQIVTAVIPCRLPVRYVPDLGTSFPLHLGAAGKAALAAMPDEELGRFLSHSTFEHITSYRPDPGRLRAELTDVRRQGYAISTGERLEGASATATVIRDADDNARAVLGLMMPSFRAGSDRLHALGALLAREVNGLYVPALANRQ